jgi:hypothetical protein
VVIFKLFFAYLSDRNLKEYFQTFANLEIKEIWIDKLNLKPGVWDSLVVVLEKNYPELLDKWRKVLFSKSKYWDKLKKKIEKICGEKGIACTFCY